MNENTIANRYFYKFSEKELEILSLYSNSEVLTHYRFLKKRKRFLKGLFYEIGRVEGNWNFKNRVLPGLFEELYKLLEICLESIKTYNDNHDSIQHYYITTDVYKKDHEKSDLQNLLFYHVEKFKSEFINFGKQCLSDYYTHNWLRSLVIKTKIRVLKGIETYIELIYEECKRYAHEGLKNLVISRLKSEHLPILSTPEILADKYNVRTSHDKELYKKLVKCFQPNGNSGSHLGLAPIWEDVPGRGMSAYYFDRTEIPMVLIVDRAKAPFIADDGIPYAQTGTPIIELFEQIGQKERFLSWFNSEKVKDALAWKLLFNVVYKYVEIKRELSEEDLEKSSEYAKRILALLDTYYGITYDFEELTNIMKQKEIGLIQEYNIEEELKEKQIQIVSKLFPNKTEAEK